MCGSDTKVSASVPAQQIQEQRHGRCGAPGPASRSAPASWRRKPLNSEDIPQSENSCPANRRSLWLGSRAADPGSCILFITLKLATLAAPIHSASWGPFFLISLLLLQEVALAEQPSRRSWSCIIFVTRKLATLAVDAVLRAAPGLGFLTAAPFMGYGGDTSAASMDVNVRLKFTVEDFLRKIRRYLGAGVSDGGPSYGLGGDTSAVSMDVKVCFVFSSLCLTNARRRGWDYGRRRLSWATVATLPQHPWTSRCVLNSGMMSSRRLAFCRCCALRWQHTGRSGGGATATSSDG